MTSTNTTTSTRPVFRPVLFFVLGLALSIFGVFHCLKGYPGPDTFVRFTDALPMLWAMASFAIGVAAAVAGLGLLLPTALRLRRGRQPQPAVYPGSMRPQIDRGSLGGRPVRHDDDYGHDPDGYDEDEYRGGTGSGYGGAYGGSYAGSHHDNGEYDHRRRDGAYR